MRNKNRKQHSNSHNYWRLNIFMYRKCQQASCIRAILCRGFQLAVYQISLKGLNKCNHSSSFFLSPPPHHCLPPPPPPPFCSWLGVQYKESVNLIKHPFFYLPCIIIYLLWVFSKFYFLFLWDPSYWFSLLLQGYSSPKDVASECWNNVFTIILFLVF